ncbi:hypothetical protein CDIK_4590, partial [Cucumispora dikerogammari]
MQEDTLDNTETRKARKTITGEILNSIRRSVDRGQSAKEIAQDENLSIKATYNLIGKINEGESNEQILGKKKGRKAVALADIKTNIINTLQRDCSFTQSELGEELRDNNLRRSQSTISRIL